MGAAVTQGLQQPAARPQVVLLRVARLQVARPQVVLPRAAVRPRVDKRLADRVVAAGAVDKLPRLHVRATPMC